METSRAILLRKTNWSETSLIISWLTEEHGAVRTVARGARKAGSAFAGKLDLFYLAEINFRVSIKSDLHVLQESHVLRAFDPNRAGSGGFYLAAYFAELAGRAAPAMSPAPEIFDLLRRGLDYVQNTPAEAKGLLHFEKELCRELGVYDASGQLSPAQALESLYGRLPASRETAWRFLEQKKSSRQPPGDRTE